MVSWCVYRKKMKVCFTTYELRRHGLMLGFDVVDVSNVVPKPLDYCPQDHATSFEIFAAISFGFGSGNRSGFVCHATRTLSNGR